MIISNIQKTKHNFDLSTEGMIALSKGGASSRLIHFMTDPFKPPEAQKETMTAATGETDKEKDAAGAAQHSKPSASNLPTEIALYVKKNDQWVEVQPEIVNWKTGGVLKIIASAGIVKGDVNGNINGPHSCKAVRMPLEVLIVAPEGVAITEYQLTKLREQKDYSELPTVTGGGLRTSGRATRDL
ncbi:MAG: hypothetical protein ABSH28_20000 [Acidobacteriota bacterium]